MKRSTLACTLALLLGPGHAGAAVTLNSEGLGQGLLFPFFTTQNGQTTLLNLQNQSPDAKALKVRVMEGYAGAETLTFNVYIPPYGRWSAALALPEPGDDKPAALISAGKGCSVPGLASPQPLLTFGFDGDGGPQTPARTQRGYVEVVEMGTLAPALSEAVFGDLSPLWGGVEPACELLVSRMLPGGLWDATPNADLGAPSGNLRGDATLMNTAEGTSFGYPALAFNGLASAPRQFSLQGQGADLLSPRLRDIQPGPEGDVRVATTDANGTPVSLRYAASRGFEAISALLATTQVRSLYNIHPSVDARSEWIVSFPTRADQRRAVEVPVTMHDCPRLATLVRTENGAQDASGEDAREIETCGNVSAFQVYSVDGISFEGPPEIFGFDSNRAPIVVRDNDDETGFADAGYYVNFGHAIGNLELDFVREDFLVDGYQSTPDLDGKCWAGRPAWVWQLQTYDNANATPGRIATFPESRVASRTFKLVECSTPQ